jgi:hypothetical protein
LLNAENDLISREKILLNLHEDIQWHLAIFCQNEFGLMDNERRQEDGNKNGGGGGQQRMFE